MPTTAELKQAFRKQQLARMSAQKAETQAAGPNLLAQLMATAAWQQAQTIGATVSGALEVPTKALIQAAKAAGKQVYLPKVMPRRQMAFLPDPGEEHLVTSNFGLQEPAYDPAKVNQKLDLLIVPGIAFALDTNARIGFGGGYYDRFLANFTGNTITLAPPVMTFATAQWPLEATDIALQLILTVKA